MDLLFPRNVLFSLLLCAGLIACDSQSPDAENPVLTTTQQQTGGENTPVAPNPDTPDSVDSGSVDQVASAVTTPEGTPPPDIDRLDEDNVSDTDVETSATSTGDGETELPETSEPADATDESTTAQEAAGETEVVVEPVVDLDNLHNYADQAVPFYITKDNTSSNTITDAGATLGRVLFYDKNLSTDNTVSCASCHQQAVGFSDPEVVSNGVNGSTGRHSMRLVNARFSDETKFFWDERADTLEIQTTQPIRDHSEMGFSGSDDAPEFADLLLKLADISYYEPLFVAAYGNSVITEGNIQNALAQFIRSMQSFDSRYDQGRASANGDRAAFANFTAEENEGKRLFLDRIEFSGNNGQRLAGSGLGCQACHRAPEFDIDPNTRNNGVVSVAGNALSIDTGNTRSPTLRDLFNANGGENGPFMHDGSAASFNDVLNHYNDITVDRANNRDLDNRLSGGDRNAPGQKLLLTDAERSAITAFMKTLTGNNIYTDSRWSDPFDENGNLQLR